MSEVNNDFLEYGASFLVTKRDYDLYYNDPDSLLGAGGQRFIAPSNQMDQLLIVANGDIGIIEEWLVIENDKLAGQELVRIDIDKSIVNDFYESGNLKLPTGSESGANSNWIPGGETSGGINDITNELKVKSPYTNSITECESKLKELRKEIYDSMGKGCDSFLWF